MSDELEQILSAVDYWRLHANDLKAEGGFAHMPVTDLRAILDHIDTLTRETLLTPEMAAVIAFAFKHEQNPNLDTARQLHEQVRTLRALEGDA